MADARAELKTKRAALREARAVLKAAKEKGGEEPTKQQAAAIAKASTAVDKLKAVVTKLKADLEPASIPEWADDDGNIVLTKLRGSDFPSTKAGKLAYCDYQSAKWAAKKARIEAASDPTSKKQAKIASLKKKLALLEAEVAEETGDGEETDE